MDDDVLDSLLILAAAAGDTAAELEAATRAHGLTGSEFRLLQFLDRIAPASVSMATTARELGLTPSGFSRVVAGLAERGLAQRTADSRDSRAGVVALTPAGRTALAAALVSASASAEGVFRRLSVGQRKQLDRLMGELVFRAR